MSKNNSYDSIIIGFGKGGKTLAGALAQKGERVALIEKSTKMYGGTCINVGCIPSKFLITNAEKIHDSDIADFTNKAKQYEHVIQKKQTLIEAMRKKNYEMLANLDSVTIFDGTAEFVSKNTIRIITDNATQEIEAQKIFINTGSTSVIVPIDGIKNNPHVFTSDTLMDLKTLPQKLTIIGGGYIGLEFASMYANFGSKVTVLQNTNTFLPREDRDVANAILKRLQEKGISVIFDAQVTKIEHATVHYTVNETEQVQDGSAILLAIGRKPNTSELHAERAGITLTKNGAIQVNEKLQTSVDSIWAMGDVCGGLQFTYISLDDFRIVFDQLYGSKNRTTQNRGAIPYSVFIDPPFSRIGLSEQEATQQGFTTKTLVLPASAIPKALVLNQKDGILKAIIDEKTGHILGAVLFCAESHEMINILKIAMDAKVHYNVLKNGIFTHPTMSEALNQLFSLA